MQKFEARVFSVHVGNHEHLAKEAQSSILAATLTSQSSEPLENTAFPKAGKLKRGLVGSVEVAETINAGDVVEITVYEHPSWLHRSA